MAQIAMPFRWRKFQDEAKAGMHQDKIMQKRPITKKEQPQPASTVEDDNMSSEGMLGA
jgi:hypothetical protein